MSSVTSQMAQIGRRINYFRCLADISGYDVSQNTTDYNSWKVNVNAGTQSTSGTILQDMGEMAKVSGQIFRKVREIVNQTQATGALTSEVFWIVVPGGEYPVQGVATGGGLAVTAVARLG